MLRKLVAAVSIAVLSAFAAGSAFAAPGGLGPPGPDTPSGEAISRLYWIVLGLCAVVFVLVGLILFIVRFRRRRTHPGAGGRRSTATPGSRSSGRCPRDHPPGSRDLTHGIPAVQAQGVRRGSLTVRVEAPVLLGTATRTANDREHPYLRSTAVELELTGMDVIHSWWVPALTGKMDAIPGRINSLRFVPEATGDFEGKCAELCGVQHAFMPTTVTVLNQDEYESMLASQQETLALGKATWEGACATCHGLDGQGDVGPSIAGNGTLTNREGLDDLLHTGQNTSQFDYYMPPVARGWPPEQLDALIAYIESNKTLSTAPPTTTGGGG
jgi:heme/copper-type cytochrome/quinol oxidase subunit 2